MDANGNPDINDYKNAFKRMEKAPLIAKACLGLGGVIMFLAIFFKYPTFIYFLAIGGSLVLYFLIYTLVTTLKKKYAYRQGPKVTKVKEVKIKKAKVQKIKDDKEHIIAICPNCKQKIRFPNKKGLHNATCPKCKADMKVKI